MPEEYKIVLNAQTNLYEVVEKAGRSVDELKRKTEDLNRMMEENRRRTEQMGETTKKTTSAMGELAVGIGKAFDVIAVEEFLRRSFLAFSQMQEGLTRIQNATGATKREMEDFKESIARMSTISGESFGKLTEAFGEFFSVSRLGYEDAKKVFMGINENARLAGVSVQEMSRNTMQALAQLQIPANEVNEVLGELVTKFAGVANKEFIRDMPRLIEQMHQMGVEGKEAVQGVANSLATMTMAMGSTQTASKGLNSVIEQMGHSHSLASRAMLNDIANVMNTTKDLGQALEVAYKNYEQLGVYDKDFANRTLARDRAGVSGEQAEAVKAYVEMRHKILESMDSEEEKQRKLNELLKNSQTALQGLMAQVESIAGKVGNLLDKIGVTRALQDFAKIIDDIGKGVDYINDKFEKNAKIIEGIGKAFTLPGWAKLPNILSNLPTPGPNTTFGAGLQAAGATGYASGGIVNSPTLAMVGEAGPEAIIPLGRGSGGNGSRTTEDNTTAIKELTSLLRDSLRDSGGGGRGRPFGGGGGDGGGGYYGGGYSGDDYAGGSEGGGYGISDGGSGGGAGGGAELASAEVGEDSQFGPLGTLEGFKARQFAYTPGAEEEPWSAVAGRGQVMGGGPIGRAGDPRGLRGGAGYGYGGFRPGIGGSRGGPRSSNTGRTGPTSSSTAVPGSVPAIPEHYWGPPAKAWPTGPVPNAMDPRVSDNVGKPALAWPTNAPGQGAAGLGTTAGVTREGMAMLDTIATREAEPAFDKAGNRAGWNTMVGGAHFDPNTEEHPHKAYPGMAGYVGGAGRSYASGRYQETTATYYENVERSKRLHPGMHVSGWSPEAQNIRNWDKAQEVYRQNYKALGIPGLTGDFQKDLEANKDNPEILGRMSSTLHNEWTSAPGGHEGSKQTGGKETYYSSTYQKMLARTSQDPALAPGTSAAAGPGADVTTQLKEQQRLGGMSPLQQMEAAGIGGVGKGPAVSGGGGQDPMSPLAAKPGHKPDLASVDPRLKEILQAGATHLPEGYSVRVTSGRRANDGPHGSRAGAIDAEIVWHAGQPDEKVIPYRGQDTTGLYTMLGRAEYGEMLARYPELKGKWNWGGAFGTSSKNPEEPDLMHSDLSGHRGHISKYDVYRLGPLPDDDYGDVRQRRLRDAASAKGAKGTTAPTPSSEKGSVTVGQVTSAADADAAAAAERALAQKLAAKAKQRKKDRDVTQSKDFSKSKSRQSKRDTERDANEHSVVDY